MSRRTVFALLLSALLLLPCAAHALTPAPPPAPVITLVGEAAMTVDAAFTFEDPGATAVGAGARI